MEQDEQQHKIVFSVRAAKLGLLSTILLVVVIVLIFVAG